MRGKNSNLTIGQRVAWYRRRRGMSQEILAGRVDRTVDWLSKIENDRIELDRLSVIKALADALDITLGDLLAEPSLLEWSNDTGTRTLPALRAALMDYRRITSPTQTFEGPVPTLAALDHEVGALWSAYQASRFGYVATLLPSTLAKLQSAADYYGTMNHGQAHRLLALAYQLASVQLTKFGEVELAWIAADRGLMVARTIDDIVVKSSLLRSVVHALLASGRFHEAVQMATDTADFLEDHLSGATDELLAVAGTLYLGGSMAAARDDDPSTTRAFLRSADDIARRLGRDANLVWTAFGPTNVAIHRVATAAELGDIQVAVDLGPGLDTSALPMERRVRHALEVARALSAWNRVEEAMSTILDAEQLGPEQVRYHYLSRQLVLTWVRKQRGKPPTVLAELANRIGVFAP